ncbi:Os07g0133700 [Oryza sativa Japonica Group]|uniref:Os07g0133700 protein n=1 Tax=Oryza sativa subsp. japonica TaxID=39947 RepID=Q0D8S1_ORYSJ|nr:Os07g0133700 [Oryza sativa Japonica Group]|eukprot:NP_001058838.2 Os07g0133700 [Oryza sativa Japonica Group]
MDLVRALAAIPARHPLPPSSLTKARRHGPQPSTTVLAPVPGGMLDRRRLLLIPAISISIGSFDKGAAKAEFADMPALRGKDYGKTKMKYPDYTETESGLQYKDLRVGDGPSPKKGETVVVSYKHHI